MQGAVLPKGGQPKNDSFGTGRIDAMLCIANTPPAGPTHDIAMGAVLAPADKIDPMTPLAPMVVVREPWHVPRDEHHLLLQGRVSGHAGLQRPVRSLVTGQRADRHGDVPELERGTGQPDL